MKTCVPFGFSSLCLFAGLVQQGATGQEAETTETYSLTVWGPEVQDQGAGSLVSSEASLGLQMATISLCPHMVFPLCVSASEPPLFIGTPVIKG